VTYPTYDKTNNQLLGDISAFQTAIEEQRAYSVSTNILTATAGQYIHVTFTNPANSGKNIFLVKREFTNDSKTDILVLTFKPVIEALTGGTVMTGGNLYTGGAPSAAYLKYLVNTTNIDSSTATNMLPINGITRVQDVVRVLRPGDGFTYQIAGAGGSLVNATKATMLFAWYEEDA
jgi:hypothetical protein